MPEPKKKTVKTLVGGSTRPPIYTSNPNDPRIQAYQDSLTTYNLAPEFTKKKASEYFKSKTNAEASDRVNRVEAEFKKKGFKRRLWIDAFDGGRKEGFNFGITEGVYKKPVQPVLYAAERPKVDKTVVKPKGASLSVKKKDLQPQKSLPKSVTGFKMDASGANVYLSVNGKQTVMPKKEFTSWLQNPDNRAMYDKYRSSQAKTLKKK
jgi:hypothetical protein